ncbi:MAG: CHASE domain-containing protein [bacterium]
MIRSGVFKAIFSALLVLLISGGVTGYFWSLYNASLSLNALAVYQNKTEALNSRIMRRLQENEQILRGAAGLINANNAVSRNEWRQYVATLGLAENYPGTQGVGFSIWVPAAQREAHIRALRAEGFPDYKIRPDGERAVYTAIIYLEPFDWRNQRAFGYDMYSESVRRSAMEKARDTGKSTVSGKIILVQETDQDVQNGFLIFAPVYRQGMPTETVEQRRAAILGFAYSPIRTRDFILGSFGRLPEDIAFEVYASDKEDPASLLFCSTRDGNALPVDYKPEYRSKKTINILDSEWVCTFNSLPTFSLETHHGVAAIILVGGVLLDVMLAGIVFILILSSNKSRASARAISESEARFRGAFEHSAIGMALVAPSGAWLKVNESLCSILGYREDELVKMTFQDITHPDDLAPDLDLVRRLLAGEDDTYSLEKRYFGKDGKVVTALLSVSLVRNSGGKPLYFISQVQDISQRKKSEVLLQARVHLMEYSLSHSLNEMLVETLDRLEGLTGSLVGFFHFLETDERALTLQAWSTRTKKEFCLAEGAGRHYDVEKAGVWVDCIHQRKPVIHNDYAALPHRKGMPPGHSPIMRELVVPIIRSGNIVGILGVGNKPVAYTEEDVDTVSRFADLAWEISERKKDQEMLRESNERFAVAFNNAPVMMTISSLEDGVYLDVNRSFTEVSGFKREEVIGKTSVEINWVSEATRKQLPEKMAKEGRISDWEITLTSKAGEPLICRYWGEIITIAGKKRVLSIAIDITDERRLSHQLFQAQKMESVGCLAGGVAHDINNNMFCVLGFSELVLESLGEDSPLRPSVENIRNAANQAANVTKQLLAFSRHQIIQPRPMDLDAAIVDLQKMLHRVIGENINIRLELEPKPKFGVVDASQFQQVLLNLCINARDAMPNGGTLTISSQVVGAPHRKDLPAIRAGALFIRVSVVDTGCGMTAKTISQIFEPFFTSKEIGKGTGLGLAVVLGIVQQHGGWVDVSSQVGRGSRFDVYFPHSTDKSASLPEESPMPRGNGEGLLLVEDDDTVRGIASTWLRDLGYRVIEAEGVESGSRKFHAAGGDVHVLLSDVGLPDGSGIALAERIVAINPSVKVILSSGYTDERSRIETIGEKHWGFLMKPYSKEDVARMIHSQTAI